MTGSARGGRRRTRSTHHCHRVARWSRTTGTVGVVVAVIGIFSGTAMANWGAIGTGSGEAEVGATVPLTVTAGSPTAMLFPGGTSAVQLTVSNPNASSIVIRSFTLDTTQGTGGFSADAAHSGCAVSALTFTASDNGGDGWTVPANTAGTPGVLAVTLAASLGMSLDAANACQGVVPLVYLTAGSQ